MTKVQKILLLILCSLFIVPLTVGGEEMVVLRVTAGMMFMLFYFFMHALQEKERGTMALLLFGMVVINIPVTMVAWATSLIPMFFYALLIGCVCAIVIHTLAPMQKVARFLNE